MRSRWLSRLIVVGGLVWIGAIAIGLLLQPAAVAHSIDLPRPIASSAPPAAVVTDTRWLNLIASIAPQHRSSAGTPTLHLHLTDQIAAGQVTAAGTVYITVTRGGSLYTYRQVTPFPMGGSFMYVATWSCYYDQMSAPLGGGLPYCSVFQPGDVVWVNQAGSIISLTVPALTALADAPGDEVYGIAPISQSVTAYLYPFTAPDALYTQTAQADANGNYQAIFTPTLDVRPRDNGYVMHSPAIDRAVYARFVAPQLRVLVGGLEVAGYAAPNALVTITATRSDGTPRTSMATYAALDGSFAAMFYNAATVQPGEHIVATAGVQTISMTVMTLTAQINLANGLVGGETLPDQPIEVERFAGPVPSSSNLLGMQPPLERATITTTATGQYTATLALARPNFGWVSLTQPDGHQTVAYFVVPYLNVRLGGLGTSADRYAVTGQIGEGLTPVTLTIQGASGYVKDVRHVTTSATGYFYDTASALEMRTGDVLTVTSPHGVQAAFVAPGLSGQIDPESDIISGTAPANAPVSLVLNYYQIPTGGGGGFPPSYSGYTAIVTANAQGRYQIDLHGVIDLNWYSAGEAQVTTSDGHGVTRAFDALSTAGCLASLNSVSVAGNVLNLLVTGNCRAYGQINVQLRAPNGQLKAEQTFSWFGFVGGAWFSAVLVDHTGRPIAIAPRDTLELTWSDWAAPPVPPTVTPTPTSTPTRTPTPTKTSTPASRAMTMSRPAQANYQFQSYTVPTLTAQLDLNANMITGEAPANSILSLLILDARIYGLSTPVDAQGHYTLTVSGANRLTGGERAHVSWYDNFGTQWYTYGVAPLLKVATGSSFIELRQMPLTPLTITLRSMYGQEWTLTGQTTYDGLLNLYPQSSSIGVGDRLTMTTPQTVTTLIVPDLVAQIDRATATVYGRAPVGAALRVDLTSAGRSQWITATASGLYTATFADLAPLTYADGMLTYLEGEVKQVTMGFSTGRWTVALGEHCTDIVAEMTGKALTMTLESPPGIVREVITHPAWYGSKFTDCFNRTLETGDRLMLAYSSGVSNTLTLPPLTVRHDYARQIVSGQAPASMQLEVTANNRAVVRHVWSEANGSYGADLSDRPLAIGTLGQVSLTNAAGNIIIRRFMVIGLTRYLPVMLK